MSRTIHVVNVERQFRIDELFFSTTDAAGVITFGNEVFVRVSGYTRQQLMGRPHNVIRHRDMPAAVFQLLWEYLDAGKSIAAYVKNRAADGSFYWVVAVVAPIADGFLSIRLKPSTPLHRAVIGVYAKMLEIEQAALAAGQRKSDALKASRAFLEQTLAALGFVDYDEFMQAMLVGEVRSRRETRPRGRSATGLNHRAVEPSATPGVETIRASSSALASEISRVFDEFSRLGELHSSLREQVAFIRALSERLGQLSLNAQIRAAALGQDGATLAVVAEHMSHSARAINSSTADVCQQMAEVGQVLDRAARRVATSDLSVEMMQLFADELTDASALQRVKPNLLQLAEVVERNITETCKACAQTAERLVQLDHRLNEFLKAIRTLEILHVTGKVEAVRYTNGETVLSIFHDVEAETLKARLRLTDLAEVIAKARLQPPNAALVGAQLAALRAG